MSMPIRGATAVGLIVTTGGALLIVLMPGVGPEGPYWTYAIGLFLGLLAVALVCLSADKLGRFVEAQQKGGSYLKALEELRAGEKTGHWIWWVFPQLKGLGTSHNSTYYGLTDEDEAAAYLAHPLLGARYRECASVVHEHLCQGGVEPLTLMGSEIDVVKLRSSLKLFLEIAPPCHETFRKQAEEILKVLGEGRDSRDQEFLI